MVSQLLSLAGFGSLRSLIKPHNHLFTRWFTCIRIIGMSSVCGSYTDMTMSILSSNFPSPRWALMTLSFGPKPSMVSFLVRMAIRSSVLIVGTILSLVPDCWIFPGMTWTKFCYLCGNFSMMLYLFLKL